MDTILVIDDDDQLRKSFTKLLKEEKYSVKGAASGEAGIEIVKKIPLALVVLDMRLPGINGMETFKQIKKIDSKLPVIIITAFGTTQIAIEATKLGAYDYVLKPFDVPDMLNLIAQAVEAGYFMRSPVNLDAAPDKQSGDVMIGQSNRMQKVYKSIGRLSQTDATVLILGESGTGKELVARAVYHHGPKSDKAFLVINCVAIPENLLESELFGYEKGAFTGAFHQHIGKIEQANGGTVFLDEIGDMPLNIQAKILRLLEEKSIERLGGNEIIPVDVRIIAATNKNLQQAIEEKKFREDLYFRLSVVTIELPPLRDRQEDINCLISYYMGKFSNILNIGNPGIQPEVLELLNSYGWPGNVRELSNLIQKVLIFNRGAPVSVEDLEQVINKKEKRKSGENIKLDDIKILIKKILSNKSGNHSFDNFIDIVSSIVVTEALKITNGNRSQAAKLLSLSRPTLHAKIDKYKIKLKTEISD